jgi:hypothetical protein
MLQRLHENEMIHHKLTEKMISKFYSNIFLPSLNTQTSANLHKFTQLELESGYSDIDNDI